MSYFESLIDYGTVKKGTIVGFSEKHLHRYWGSLHYCFREVDNLEVMVWMAKNRTVASAGAVGVALAVDAALTD